MSDEVKGFRERITAAMERIAAGHSPMRIPADMTDPDIVLSDCLARIEGEAARTAAAVAAATSAARKIADRWVDEKDRADYATAALRLHGFRECDIAACNCGSWHAPPNLRAEKAEAERDEACGLTDALRISADANMALAERLERTLSETADERDALRAQTALSDGPCVECGEPTQWAAGNPGLWVVMLPTEVEPGVAKHHHVQCVLGWRAQVEAARALCADFDRGGGLMWPGEVLAAMDGAKP